MPSATDASCFPSSNRVPTTRRAFIVTLIAILLAGAAIFVRDTPAKISSYDQLEPWLDRRVEFIGVFEGDQKAYDLIVFQGRPILFQHTLGAIKWSPDTGERCRVVGRVKRYGRPLNGIDGRVDFTLTNADYYPEPNK